jgi:methyl-accepting chemotaxis protein
MVHSGSDRADSLRRATGRRLAVLLGLLTPVLGLTALAIGHPLDTLAQWVPLGLVPLLAAATALAWLPGGNALAARLIGATGLVSAVSVLVFLLADTPWAGLGDLLYIAAVALLAASMDWRVLALAASVAIAERLVLLLALSGASSVPGAMVAATGPDMPRLTAFLAALALLLLFVTAALIWLVREAATTEAAARDVLARTTAAAEQNEQALRLTSETASDLAGRATEDRLARSFETEVGGLVGGAAKAAAGVLGAVHRFFEVAAEATRRTAAIAHASSETSAAANDVAQSVEKLAASVAQATRDVRSLGGLVQGDG